MTKAHRRHDLSDKDWALLEPHLPGRAGQWGGVAEDNRRFASSTQCSGFCARALHGVTYRPFTVIGRTPIGASAAGAKRAYGKRYWNASLMSQATSG